MSDIIFVPTNYDVQKYLINCGGNKPIIMAIEILSYPSSFLNPLLKAIVPVIFAVGTIFFYQAYTSYGGNLKKIALFLLFAGIAGTLAAGFRYLGDFFISWKWGESVFLLIFAIVSILVAYLVYTRFMEIAIIFGMTGEDE